MAEQLWHAIQGLPDWLAVAILSAAPISEVRGGIPVGLCYYNMPIWLCLPVAIASNVVSVLWIVPTYNWMARTFDATPGLGRLFRWLTARAEKRRGLVEKYGVLAVTVLVAVPLPVTGAWTGSVIASVFRMPFAKAALCMLLGVLIASTIVTGLTLGGVEVFNAIHVRPDVAAGQ